MQEKRKKKCPYNCPYLDPKEADQTTNKESHFCRLHRCVVRHEGRHPHLMATPKCTFDSTTSVGPFLFLDVDGVINDHEWLVSNIENIRSAETLEERSVQKINPAKVELLNLLSPLGFKVVVSSCWRQGETLESLIKLFLAVGLRLPVIGLTPYIVKGVREVERGLEIHCWLEENGASNEKFVIVDDSSDMGPLLNRLVRTETEVGLTENSIIEIKYLLKRDRTKNFFANPIPQTELRDGAVYLLDARCGNIGMWNAGKERFAVPSFSCGRKYLEEELYWNKKAHEGSALPLMLLGQSAVSLDDYGDLLEYLDNINSKAENAVRLAAAGIEPTRWWIKEINWSDED